ncbi:efflux RND transporter permease subunit [Halovenus marina]|uniref:efflux RND transporter permease subunit n=1 Tax=Halovenus marina TaxID=3396621 RepID=UPI003F54EAF5
MFGSIADRVSTTVTDHPLLVIVAVLLLTVGVGAGLPQLDMANQTNIDDEVFERTAVGDALEYTNAHYGDDEETALSSVYLRPADGNALSRESLIRALEYQQTVLDNETVAAELVDGRSITGPATFVGTELASEDASPAEMQAAIEDASDERLDEAIEQTLSDGTRAGQYLPRGYEPGTAEAESVRLLFEFEQAGYTQQQEPLPDERAQQVLFDAAEESDDLFTMGTLAQAEWSSQQIMDVFWLIVPPALLLVVAVLAFAYRDLVDILVGFVGVCVSVLWFFGILGWLGIPAGFASIVGPILIVALSIDFGLHVIMRYREQRGPAEGIRPPLARSGSSVLVAFVLVALTAGVGFLANVTNPIGFIRAFGVVITLGVFASVFVFVTLVPALKLVIDSRLEGHGFDRRKQALGTSGVLKPVLSSGVTLARSGAVAVVVLSLVVGGLGLVSYTDLDRQGFQQDFADADDWQTDLPDPVGWSAHETEYRQNLDYVQAQFQSTDERARTTTFLVRGDVTDVTALERIHVGTTRAASHELAFRQGGQVPVVSPLSLIRAYAIGNEEFATLVARAGDHNDELEALLTDLRADDEAFAAALAAVDADSASELSDSADATDIEAVYDTLHDIAPEDAAAVLSRVDGEYESMRLIVPVEQGVDIDERGAAMHALADEIEGETDLRVDPVDFATVSNAGLGTIADSILWTMVLAFGGVTLVLAATYHLERRRLTLGVVTVVPIVLVTGFVFGGMYLFGVPLTFITAFLVSITIGLGIDYNIHVSDRFMQELDDGADPIDALYTTVRGTGGALLGSALTSCAAFATLLVHPSAVFQSFGAIVVLSLFLSFLVSVFVLPSFLLCWARWRG